MPLEAGEVVVRITGDLSPLKKQLAAGLKRARVAGSGIAGSEMAKGLDRNKQKIQQMAGAAQALSGSFFAISRIAAGFAGGAILPFAAMIGGFLALRKAAELAAAAIQKAVQLAVQFGVSGVRAFMALSREMRLVNTVAQVTDQRLGEMTDSVQYLSTQFGMRAPEIAKALFRINSAGVRGARGMEVLRKATELAFASGAQLETTARTLTRVMNAYGFTTEQVDRVANVMFNTFREGDVTMDEMSAALGQIAGVAASAGVSLEDMTAAFALLTRTLPAQRAAVSLERLIERLAVGNDKLDAMANRLGFVNTQQILQTKDLAGAIKLIAQETGGAAALLDELGIKRVRERRALIPLLRDMGQVLPDMRQNIDRANTLGAGLRNMEKDATFALNKLTAAFDRLKVSFGDAIDDETAALLTELTETLAQDGPKAVAALAGMAKEVLELGKNMVALRRALPGLSDIRRVAELSPVGQVASTNLFVAEGAFKLIADSFRTMAGVSGPLERGVGHVVELLSSPASAAGVKKTAEAFEDILGMQDKFAAFREAGPLSFMAPSESATQRMLKRWDAIGKQGEEAIAKLGKAAGALRGSAFEEDALRIMKLHQAAIEEETMQRQRALEAAFNQERLLRLQSTTGTAEEMAQARLSIEHDANMKSIEELRVTEAKKRQLRERELRRFNSDVTNAMAKARVQALSPFMSSTEQQIANLKVQFVEMAKLMRPGERGALEQLFQLRKDEIMMSQRAALTPLTVGSQAAARSLQREKQEQQQLDALEAIRAANTSIAEDINAISTGGIKLRGVEEGTF
jgi:TP901 family phage tail tape measure protein